eukprot:9531410-Alexandrium_andersonii.AAC.1
MCIRDRAPALDVLLQAGGRLRNGWRAGVSLAASGRPWQGGIKLCSNHDGRCSAGVVPLSMGSMS